MNPLYKLIYPMASRTSHTLRGTYLQNLFLRHRDTFAHDRREPQAINRVRLPDTLHLFDVEIVLLQRFHDGGNVSVMLFYLIRKDDDVIQVGESKQVDKGGENRVNEPLKARGSGGETMGMTWCSWGLDGGGGFRAG